MSAQPDAAPARTALPESSAEADRLARLALNHAVEPADPHIGRLLELHSPAEVLAAIHRDQLPDLDLDPEPSRRDRLADRCTGLRLRLEPARIEAAVAAADAVLARFITPLDREWPVRLDDLGALRPIGIWAVGSWEIGSLGAGFSGSGSLGTASCAASWTAAADQRAAARIGDDVETCDRSGLEADDSPPLDAQAEPSSAEMVSIVGARACTGYGAHIAGLLGADMASAGTAVVSGAALGIDAAAHRGALAVGGPTIAVLACGIDRVYPRAHEALLRAIAERGAVLSELPPGAAPTRFRFLHRNRIIAALGVGTVIVEAARRSGSLVTARLAAELGRVVMAVPGPVTSEQSAGTHELIRDGATLVTQASQVQEACVSLTAATPCESRVPAPFKQGPESRPRAQRQARARPAHSTEPADPIEELLLEALPSAAGGVGAEVLALTRATGIGPDAVFAALGRLAAVGRAVKAGGGWMLSTKG